MVWMIYLDNILSYIETFRPFFVLAIWLYWRFLLQKIHRQLHKIEKSTVRNVRFEQADPHEVQKLSLIHI